MFFKSLFALASLALVVEAKTAAEWRSRTVYQLLTDRFAQSPGAVDFSKCVANYTEYDVRHYCGGTYDGIVSRLDYIQKLGYDAIWISPITSSVPYETMYGVGWHGYWQDNLYTLNPYFGSAEALKHFVKEAHKRGIWVWVDVVANHMGPPENIEFVPIVPSNFSVYTPFNDKKYFHQFCNIENWNNQTEVEQCSLGGEDLPLPDLDTEDPYVVQTLYSWIHHLVKEYDFDGVRIDTFRHIRKPFWTGFTKSAGVYSIGEVADSDTAYVADYQNYADGVLAYPLFFTLNNVFQDDGRQPMTTLAQQVTAEKSAFKDRTLLGTFLDNHDQPRFANHTTDPVRVHNALTYLHFGDGIPILYYGTEQGYVGNPTMPYGYNDPWNRNPLWASKYDTTNSVFKFIQSLNKLRNNFKKNYQKFFTSSETPIYSDNSTYAFTKWPATVVVSNDVFTTAKSIGVPKGFYKSFANQKLVNALSGKVVGSVAKNGAATITVANEQPVIVVPQSVLKH